MKEPINVKSYINEERELCEEENREVIAAQLRAKLLYGLFGDEARFEVGCCVEKQ